VNPRIFREYDIRGHAERDLDDAFVGDLGRAIGTHLRRAGGKTMTLGRDCRVHSPRLHRALRAGILSTGINVIDVGIVATPILYFSVFHFDADGGVQITGSHNPPDDNGFKIMGGRATLFGKQIQGLRAIIDSRDFESGLGSVEERPILEAYLENAIERTQLGPRRFKVVIDAGNGVGGTALSLAQRLGFDASGIYLEQDGRFPHHQPDPTVEKNVADLAAQVRETGAEVGIALDGDADRIGIVDEKGRLLWGDQLMILLAKAILAEVPGATFVAEVKCSQALYDEIAKAGGRAIMWKVGHSLIKDKMKAEKALLGGEMSGHIFYSHRYYGFDDAIYAAGRVLELLSRSERTLAQLVDELPRLYNTPELRFDLADDIKFEVVRRVIEKFKASAGPDSHQVVDVDGARITWKDGWALVRASNTQPVLVLRFEAETPDRLNDIRKRVEGELKKIEGEARR
jgi:phosphomannomutase/phosphoglucomutase